MPKFTELKNIITSAETDADKFYISGNKAAGTRLRNKLQEIKKLAQNIRQEITDLKKKK
jgi:hypothetical protein